MLVAVVVEAMEQAGALVLVVGVLGLRLQSALLELLTRVVALVDLLIPIMAAQAVQALSFFATPAQFNISLVAQ
jgi:hypothetical protein